AAASSTIAAIAAGAPATPCTHQQDPHLVRIRLRHDELMPSSRGMSSGKQHGRPRLQLAAQSKRAVELDLSRVIAARRMQFDLLRSQQNSECDREIEPATALGYV